MKRPGIEAVAVPLIAAGLGLGGGLVGAYLGAHATVVTQREQLQASRSAEARTKRATVYAHFLDASNRYAIEQSQSYSIARKCFPKLSIRRFSCLLGKEAGRLQNARYQFQGALNYVFVYGSAAGVRAALNLATQLPPAVGHLNGLVHIARVSDAAFARTYAAFLDVMCREVSAEPRSLARTDLRGGRTRDWT